MDETQKEIIKFEPVNELVPNEDEWYIDSKGKIIGNPHYNTALKEYQIYGTPYGKTKPASLLFRLAILCGWRKVEALTMPTRYASESTLLELADFKFKQKPSGLEVDMERGVLKVSFLTRKTKKLETHSQQQLFLHLRHPSWIREKRLLMYVRKLE